MKICAEHWAALRAAIDKRGLTAFVAKDGATAMAQMVKQIESRDTGKATFDPLMSAHWAIVNNAMSTLDRAGMNSLYLMAGGPEDPEDPVDVAKAGEKYAGRTWPRCPLCYLNLAHEISCTNPKCGLEKENGYDWMIERAAEDSLEQAREYGLTE